MTRFRRGEVFVGQHLWIERIVVAEILALESLAIDFVFLRELVSFRRVERAELADGLRGEGFAVHEKKDASRELRFEQPVNLRDGEKSFSRPRRHRHHGIALAAFDGALDRENAIALVRPQPPDVFRRGREQPIVRGLQVVVEPLCKRVGRM